jgi:hypothetical protein
MVFSQLFILIAESSLCTKLAIQNAFSNTQGFGGYFQKLVVGDKFQTFFQTHSADGDKRQGIVTA